MRGGVVAALLCILTPSCKLSLVRDLSLSASGTLNDSTAPVVSFGTGATGSVFGPEFSFSWSGTDSGSGVASYSYVLYEGPSCSGTVLESGSTATPAITRELEPGTYSIRVTAVDQAGNASSPVCSAALKANGRVIEYPGGLPVTPVSLGAELYYVGSDAQHGAELWATDGTPAGTRLVVDTIPGAESGMSSYGELHVSNGYVYFSSGTSGSDVRRLWRTDGTAAGTIELHPDVASSTVGYCAGVGATFYFIAKGTGSNRELWKTDGTVAGTVMVKDMTTLVPQNLVAFAGNLLFTTSTSLWKSDGTTAGTVELKTLLIVASAPVVVGGMAYFSGYDILGGLGNEFWKTDGTPGGTVLVSNINPGIQSSFPMYFTGLGTDVYFAAANGVNGYELWKSDGTGGGTALLKEIVPGAGSSMPSNLIEFSGTLLFTASDPTNGTELWKSDGTLAGTVLVKDIHPGSRSGVPTSKGLAFGGSYFFAGDDGTSGVELWKSDGTAAGTVLVKDIHPGSGSSMPGGFVQHGGFLYFLASASDEATGSYGLWRTDGTAAGTVPVTGVRATSPGNPIALVQSGLVPPTLSGKIFYPMGSGVVATDGTRAGTIAFSSTRGQVPTSRIAILGGTAFFPLLESLTGAALWKSDGTEAGTSLLIDIDAADGGAGITGLTPLASSLVFSGYTSAAGSELWKSDGTAAGTSMVMDIRPGAGGSSPLNFVVHQGLAYFGANGPNGFELWRTDGTPGGTSEVADIHPGASSGLVNLIYSNGTELFFAAVEGTNGVELWKSDGTSGGTVLVKDINPGAGSGLNVNFSVELRIGSTIFFAADDGTTGLELWKSDGTAAGTTLVKDINPGAGHGIATVGIAMNAAHSTSYFVANDGVHGRELWTTDGTAAGTRMVKDIYPGSESGLPGGSGYAASARQNFVTVNGYTYFTATDGTHGIELWRTDGTEAGTTLVGDVRPGSASSTPVGLALSSGGKLIFWADDGRHGLQLHTYDPN